MIQNMIRNIVMFFIWLYQKTISPHLGSHCRYYPTCSAYAYEAVQKHGAYKGSVFALKRVLRCHPFHKGGYDPVP
jgi:putative membrane protein insertion efficiency factor